MTDRARDGFELVHDRMGSGPGVVLLHGWPGDRTDYRDVVPLLSPRATVVTADLRGFGDSRGHPAPAQRYSAAAQAEYVAALIETTGLRRPVVAGYDVGSVVAQALARDRPELVSALVLSPPMPGVGERILDPRTVQEFWYQQFHQLPLIESLLDGRPDAVRAYLRHIWDHWSAPDYTIPPEALDHLVEVYGAPGAFTASVSWYRAGAGAVQRSLHETAPAADRRIAVPTTVLWPDSDPLFPFSWSDRLDAFFTDVRVRQLRGSGHFTPLEAPAIFAEEVLAATR